MYDGVGYTSFLIPGLVMMSVLQNAFANSSSSLVQSKITRQPRAAAGHAAVALGLVRGYVGASIVRGLAAGVRCW